MKNIRGILGALSGCVLVVGNTCAADTSDSLISVAQKKWRAESIGDVLYKERLNKHLGQIRSAAILDACGHKGLSASLFSKTAPEPVTPKTRELLGREHVVLESATELEIVLGQSYADAAIRAYFDGVSFMAKTITDSKDRDRVCATAVNMADRYLVSN